jgi:hemoglobin/transferrin/lactoferrin receptor protein
MSLGTIQATCGLAILVLILSAAWSEAAVPISGTVVDGTGAAIGGAEVVLATPELTVLAVVRTDAQGRFTVHAPAAGTYLLITRAAAFGETRQALVVRSTPAAPLQIVLQVGALQEDVTVTASRETVDSLKAAAQPVNVITADEIALRVRTVVAEAIGEETGVNLQRTSPTMAGVFVRGLTGNKVNVFVDGVRYSNGAQRGGVNTFLDLIEPGALEAIEVVRGPSSSQYGSDALGGSVQFFSKPPMLGAPNGPRWGGTFAAGGGTSHRNGSATGLAAYTGTSLGVTGSFSLRRTGALRAGGGIDSHAAVTRFFGVRSDALMGERLADTGFHQFGGAVRANWVPDPNSRIVASYTRTFQDGGKRYDQLLGGDGNLIADLNALSLDLVSVRFERLGTKPFEHLSLTYSVNSQREERVNQGGNGNPAATIGHEPERTTVHGVQGAVSTQLSERHTLTFGGDVYFERLASDSYNVNPATGGVTPRRPRVPDGARFTQGGAYAQSTYDLRPEKLRLVGSLRYGGATYKARAADSPSVNGQPLWPDDSLTAGSLTFRGAAVMTPSDRWTVLGSISRGFRAPHMTDLGTLGLTGSGFEVAALAVAGLNAFVGTTAAATATSTGLRVEQVGPESSIQYESSIRFRAPRFRTEVALFVNNVHDNIQKQALILAPGAVGMMLGGQPIVSQSATGAVFVAASSTPVLVRANFDDARIWGIEQSADAQFRKDLSLRTSFTYLRAKDTATGLPPNIEGGTPAPDAWVSLRWARPSSRWWVEPYAHLAWKQPHLSSLDLGDRRTGAARSRANIRSFFLNGAAARGWIGRGSDGTFGTADDVLTATGETLAQIQDRVLGVGVNAAPLFSEIPGYAAAGVRGGLRLGPHEILIDVENLTDENYRGISWGMDAPGRGVNIRYVARF